MVPFYFYLQGRVRLDKIFGNLRSKISRIPFRDDSSNRFNQFGSHGKASEISNKFFCEVFRSKPKYGPYNMVSDMGKSHSAM